MMIPERSSRVRKWIVPIRALQLLAAGVGILLFVGVITSFMTLRYLARWGEFQEARLRIQYLEGQLQGLQSKLNSANATLVRIQNFEQKLRVLANLDTSASQGGIGPISREDEQMYRGGSDDPTKVALAPEAGGLEPYGYQVRSLELSVDDLHTHASLREQSLQETYELLKDQESLLSSRPSVWPTRGWVTSHFGYRISPFTGLRQLHEGMDIAASGGTKVHAPADGVVTFSGTEEGYGKVVVVNHGYGVVTRYAHNSEAFVKVGQRVRRGDAVAAVGNTGRSTGPHLHYEVRVNGIPVNPTRYILN